MYTLLVTYLNKEFVLADKMLKKKCNNNVTKNLVTQEKT